MNINRRDFFKVAAAGASGVALSAARPLAETSTDAGDSVAMLYDATKCVGCRACQLACKRNANLPAVTDAASMYEMPTELSANTWTLIKLYKGEDGLSFVKNQCMHCVEPACASVCPVGALEKTPEGPVIYHTEKCFGCRYCMAACPFSIPKYQWDTNTPLVQKCDFCHDRQEEGLPPACAAACPTGALIFGKRADLLQIAHERIDAQPGKYQPHVYGEKEVGGTTMLYLSHVPFEELGFPALDSNSLPKITWGYMKMIPGIIVGVGGLLSLIYARTHREKKSQEA